MTFYGDGRAALVDDAETAARLGWRVRRRSLPEPEILLSRRRGDPCREPWIAPLGWRSGPDLNGSIRGRRHPKRWTFLAEPPAVARYVERLARPAARDGCVLGVAGLGRVGGMIAALLAATPRRRSGICELLVHDADRANLERWLLELDSIAAWRGRMELPHVQGAEPDELFVRCDAFVFSAAVGVPPLGTTGDVRLLQFAPNRAILRPFLESARAAGYTGLFLIVSDPVDWLALAAFVDSNRDGTGRFRGDGLAPERIAGLGLGVMWARALARARQRGWEEEVRRFGAAFGPHSTEVLVFDDLRRPVRARSETLTDAARETNFKVRDLGFLPFVGPAVSSVGLTLPGLLAGRVALASAFLDGIYFGTPVRLRWGIHPAAGAMARDARTELLALFERLRARAPELDLVFRDA
jgi:hypothetical protein